jgi:hypothetical protein
MNQQQLQSQIALNRNLINILHDHVYTFKQWRQTAHKDNDEVYADNLSKSISKLSSSIAKYVVLQKALKKQLAQNIRLDNDYNTDSFIDFLMKAVHTHGLENKILENIRKYNDVGGMESV